MRVDYNSIVYILYLPMFLLTRFFMYGQPYFILLQVDFANQESQMAFYRSMQASGQDIRDFYDLLTDRRFAAFLFYHLPIYLDEVLLFLT